MSRESFDFTQFKKSQVNEIRPDTLAAYFTQGRTKLWNTVSIWGTEKNWWRRYRAAHHEETY